MSLRVFAVIVSLCGAPSLSSAQSTLCEDCPTQLVLPASTTELQLDITRTRTGGEAGRPFEVRSGSGLAEPEPDTGASFKLTVIGEQPRSQAMTSLYQAFVGLSAADGILTWLNVRRGAIEVNPMMQDAATSLGGLLALKASTTATTILLNERLRKEHPRRALLIMAAINGAMGLVTWRNVATLNRLNQRARTLAP